MSGDGRAFPWPVFGAEFLGTAILIGVGLSFVIVDFSPASPMHALLPEDGARRALTGLLFGTTGASVALSPLGRRSGGHINPIVSIGFWLMGRLRLRYAACYVIAQLAGGVVGALPLLAWGGLGRSMQFGATTPGATDGAWLAVAGEAATSFALVALLFLFVRTRALREFTPLLLPPLYAFMVWIEAPVSGTSTNPARSLGPAAISGDWRAWWVYWLGPLIGMGLAVLVHRWADTRWARIEVAKLKHFEDDAYGIFQEVAETAVEEESAIARVIED